MQLSDWNLVSRRQPPRESALAMWCSIPCVRPEAMKGKFLFVSFLQIINVCENMVWTFPVFKYRVGTTPEEFFFTSQQKFCEAKFCQYPFTISVKLGKTDTKYLT